MTPEQVARERALADAVRGRGVDMSPVGHWTQGAARMVEALGGVLHERRAGAADEEGRAGARATIGADPVLSALLGGSGANGAQPGPGPAVDAVMARSAPGGDWLRYSNQRAVRNQPINDDLVQALSFLPEMGVSMEVISGGQPSQGQNRVGSHRHDDGGAADVRFYRDGRALDWRNPDDIPVLQDIVRGARARGVTGFGAGEGYMSPGMMHIGFGAPAVWGAGGSGANAPDWLREAFGSTQTAGGAPGASYTAPNQNVVSALMAAQADPWVQEQYGPAIEALLGQQMQMQNTAYQSQLAQADPLYQAQLDRALLENEAMRNPAVDPFAGVEFVNDQAVTMGPDGPQVIGDFRTPNDPTSVQEYQFYREEMAKRGVPPRSYEEWLMALREAGGMRISVGGEGAPGLGSLSTDYGYVLDPETNMPVIDPETGMPRAAPIPGSLADTQRQQDAAAAEAMSAEAAAQEQRYGSIVHEDIGRVLQAVEANPNLVAGPFGYLLSSVPGTGAHDVGALLDTIRANVGFDRLQAMRAASPTGGALGAVSDTENRMLQATLGALGQSQTPAQFAHNLRRLQNLYTEIVHGPPPEGVSIENWVQMHGGDGGDPTGNAPATSDPALSPPAATAMPPDAMPAPDASSNRFASMPAQDLLSIDLDALTPAELAQWDAAMDALGF